MSRIPAKLKVICASSAGLLGLLVAVSLASEPVYAANKKIKKATHETYALAAPLPGKDSNRLRQFKAKKRLVIFGKAAWICTPSGFGRKATCAARSSFG